MRQPFLQDLLRRIQEQDEEALVELHGQFAGLVYSVAYRVLNDRMSAEEVTQDTFLRLWDKSHTYDPAKGEFTVWLLTITRRLAIDVLRQRQRTEPKQEPIFIDADPDLWEHIAPATTHELRRTLVAVIKQLPEDQQRVIDLAYFYSMSHSEIAEYLRLPLGTVKTRIRQGMKKLRDAWILTNPKEEH